MANPLELVRMSDVLDHLSLPKGETTYQTELQRYIDAATPIVEYITGPINKTTYSETYPCAGMTRIVLRNVPVVPGSVSSCVEYVGITAYSLTEQPPGSTADNYGFFIERPEAGTLVRMSSAGLETPFIGVWLQVTYQAGLSAVPADVKLAVLEDIRALWDQAHNGGRPRWGGENPGEDGWTIGPMHLFPRLAAMVENRRRTQSIA
ncbi:hypothetical protein ACFVUS_12535 [Nocardia sp. NPDC058058]|uniref:hypothetical protein n=1 Tax=Nocardia sp. NPDC058058 TaxID=3346317 RepID=UPI0036DA0519